MKKVILVVLLFLSMNLMAQDLEWPYNVQLDPISLLNNENLIIVNGMYVDIKLFCEFFEKLFIEAPKPQTKTGDNSSPSKYPAFLDQQSQNISINLNPKATTAY